MTKKRILYSIYSSIILYLIISFIKWDLLCFLIIKDLDPFSRFLILIGFICKEVITGMVYDTIENEFY